MSAHEINLLDVYGNPIRTIEKWTQLKYALIANGVGYADIWLTEAFDVRAMADVDRLLEIYREGADGKMHWQTTAFIRKWGARDTGEKGIVPFMYGNDQNSLLDRRIVRYLRTTVEAQKNGIADDIMKEYVSENVPAPITDPYYGDERGLSNFTVAANEGEGASIYYDGGWENLLDVLQFCASASSAQEIPIYFRVVQTGPAAFEFRTYKDRIGLDRTSGGAMFAQEWGNLRNAYWEEDWLEDENIVHGLGWGSGTDREVDPERDKWRMFRTPWSRIEGIANARKATTRFEIAEAARSRLYEKRPKRRLSGVLISTPEAQYGTDWLFGDLVGANFYGMDFNGLVDSVEITLMEDGREHIEARIEAEYFADIEAGIS